MKKHCFPSDDALTCKGNHVSIGLDYGRVSRNYSASAKHLAKRHKKLKERHQNLPSKNKMNGFGKNIFVCFVNLLWGAAAFQFHHVPPLTPRHRVASSSTTKLYSSSASMQKIPKKDLSRTPDGASQLATVDGEDLSKYMLPSDLPNMVLLQGGQTIRTWTMPAGTERVEYVVKSNGRPVHARVEMWLGPQRRLHGLDIYCEDGTITPLRGCFRMKKGTSTFSIRNIGKAEYPIVATCRPADDDWNKALEANTMSIFNANTKVHMQGDKAIRTWPIPTDVKSVQLIFFSGRTGKRTTKAKIEVLQAPNNIKQSYDLHCGGSSQPYHCILETPGEALTLRIWNKNNYEFPFECVVVPYEMEDPVPGKHLQPAFFLMN